MVRPANMTIRLAMTVLLWTLASAASGAQETGGNIPGTARVIDRFRFSCEWGYVQSLYHDYHYNILSVEGYRINESYYGLDPAANGLVLIGAGFVFPGDKMMISLHGGYSGINEANRIIPAILRFSFCPRTVSNEGVFYYAQAGTGFHVPSTLETRVSLLSGFGAGYRFPLTRRCSIDIIFSAMAAFSKPPIPNPDGPGYVAEENIRSNKASYGALSLTIAVNL